MENAGKCEGPIRSDEKDKRFVRVFVCLYVGINTVMLCSGVCMNWHRAGTIKKRVCVFVLCL